MYCMCERGVPRSRTAMRIASPVLHGPPITTPLPATDGTQKSRDSAVPVMPPVAMTTPMRARQVILLSPVPHSTPITRFSFSSKKNFDKPQL